MQCALLYWTESFRPYCPSTSPVSVPLTLTMPGSSEYLPLQQSVRSLIIFGLRLCIPRALGHFVPGLCRSFGHGLAAWQTRRTASRAMTLWHGLSSCVDVRCLMEATLISLAAFHQSSPFDEPWLGARSMAASGDHNLALQRLKLRAKQPVTARSLNVRSTMAAPEKRSDR